VIWTSTGTKTGYTKETFTFGGIVLEDYNTMGRNKQAKAWAVHPEDEDIMLL